MLWAYGRRHLLLVELDFEVKKGDSIFHNRSGIYEKHRQQVIQPEVIINRGFFENERNITQAINKNSGGVRAAIVAPTEEDDENASSYRNTSNYSSATQKKLGNMIDDSPDRFNFEDDEKKATSKSKKGISYGDNQEELKQQRH